MLRGSNIASNIFRSTADGSTDDRESVPEVGTGSKNSVISRATGPASAGRTVAIASGIRKLFPQAGQIPRFPALAGFLTRNKDPHSQRTRIDGDIGHFLEMIYDFIGLLSSLCRNV